MRQGQVCCFASPIFRNETEVVLEDVTSRFVMTEVLSCGRAARNERFQYRWYKNRVSIRQEDRLIYRDNTCYEPQEWDMCGFGMYEGFTHLANLVICNEPKSEQWIGRTRKLLDDTEGIKGGVTQNGENLTVVRILGKTAQSLLEIMSRIL